MGEVAGATASPGYQVAGLDHVQLAMPPDREVEAEAFYYGILGLEVIEKPPALAARGGRWFANPAVNVHLGVDQEFRPAHKAHVAFCVEGLANLVETLRAAGHEVRWDTEPDAARPDTRPRCYVLDPFGNRIELIGI